MLRKSDVDNHKFIHFLLYSSMMRVAGVFQEARLCPFCLIVSTVATSGNSRKMTPRIPLVSKDYCNSAALIGIAIELNLLFVS